MPIRSESGVRHIYPYANDCSAIRGLPETHWSLASTLLLLYQTKVDKSRFLVRKEGLRSSTKFYLSRQKERSYPMLRTEHAAQSLYTELYNLA